MKKSLSHHRASPVVAIAAVALFSALGAGPALAAPPPNDNFASATPLVGVDGTRKDTNKEATREAGEPDHAGRPGGASVWYRWTSTREGQLFLNTGGSDFDTLLGVYRGNGVGDMTEVASNDDAHSDMRTSFLSFWPVAGQTYHIAVDGFAGAAGTVQISWAQAPANDDFARAQAIRGLRGTIAGSIAHATSEPNERWQGSSIWYRWTAPTSTWVVFDTFRSEPELGWFDTVLYVYTGTDLASSTRVGDLSDDFAWPLARGRSAVGFRAVAGTTYSIGVAGYEYSRTGTTVLTWRDGRIFVGTNSRNTLTGTRGSDIILARGGSDTIRGGEGADLIDGSTSSDTLYAGGGDDVVLAGSFADFVHGGAGADVLYGEGGRDRIDARDGVRRNDTVDGGPARNVCLADRGDRKTNCG